VRKGRKTIIKSNHPSRKANDSEKEKYQLNISAQYGRKKIVGKNADQVNKCEFRM